MNVYDAVTDRLIAAMEGGTIPWRQPWKCTGEGGALPYNRASGKAYRGINIWLLACAPYASKAWMTYKQAAEIGAHVRKGEHGFPVVFWKIGNDLDPETGKQKRSFLLRQYTVFNVDQIEGLPVPLPFDVQPFNPIAAAQRVQDEFLASAGAPSFRHGGDSAYYSPSEDQIVLPRAETFKKSEGYYATFFHEAGHSTGHASRLDRKDGMHNIFGSHLYSKEELIAEFTSAFLCAECGISNEYTETNSVAYLQSWIKVLKGDKTIAVSAAQRAQKACDLILGRGTAAAAEPEAEAVAA